jgi:hypothetical protein
MGNTQQFTATGYFKNGSTENLTTSVTWSSSVPGVATITAAGLASSVSLGSTTIIATLVTATPFAPAAGVTPGTPIVVSPPTSSVSGSTSLTVTDTAPVSVNFGLTGNYLNGIFTTVTVCYPGSTTNCTTIPDVLVDSGSAGLRVLSTGISNLTTQVANLNLPPVNDPTYGYPVYECIEYGDLSFTWGPIQRATVQVGGEKALQVPGGTEPGVPIQVISTAPPPEQVTFLGEAIYNPCLYNFSTAPPTLTGGADDDTVANLRANGILGISSSPQDCSLGDFNDCASIGTTTGQYLYCTDSATCVVDALPVEDQVWNPVAAFPIDNTGVLLTLPSIPSSGQATATGTLTFGIDTESNNQIPGSATVYELDDEGNFASAVFLGTTYTSLNSGGSFIDSSSSAIYISDYATINAYTSTNLGVSMSDCMVSGVDIGYY